MIPVRGPHQSEALGGCLVCLCLRPALRRSKAAAMRRWFAAARARAADIYKQRQCSWQCHVESRGARLNIDLFSLDYRPATVS